MAYACPRCGGPVHRGASTTVAAMGGLIGALILSAFGGFRCKQCGPIPKAEFPPNVRRKMTLGAGALIVSAVVVLVLLVMLLAYLRS
jgi:hypothetical protein